MYKHKTSKGRVYYYKDNKRIARSEVPEEYLLEKHKKEKEKKKVLKIVKITNVFLTKYNKEIRKITDKNYSFEAYNLNCDVLNEINKYLYPDDIKNLRCVCKKMNAIYNEEKIKKFVNREKENISVSLNKETLLINLKNILKKERWNDVKKIIISHYKECTKNLLRYYNYNKVSEMCDINLIEELFSSTQFKINVHKKEDLFESISPYLSQIINFSLSGELRFIVKVGNENCVIRKHLEISYLVTINCNIINMLYKEFFLI